MKSTPFDVARGGARTHLFIIGRKEEGEKQDQFSPNSAYYLASWLSAGGLGRKTSHPGRHATVINSADMVPERVFSGAGMVTRQESITTLPTGRGESR